MNETSATTPDNKSAETTSVRDESLYDKDGNAAVLGNFDNLGGDAAAGLVVFLVALPLCLGIALASGAPLISGLITGITGGIVVAWVSGSPLSVSGPAAGLTTIVLGAITAFSKPFVDAIDKSGMSAEAYDKAVQAATFEQGFPIFLLSVALAGVIQLVFGFVKAGILSNFFPSTVIKGMLAAIGAILILKQLPHLVGHDSDPEGEFQFDQPDGENTFSELWSALFDLSPAAIAIGITGLIILVSYPKFSFTKNLKLMPAPLVVVILGVVVNQALVVMGSGYALSGDHLVAIPVFSSLGAVGEAIRTPAFDQISNIEVWKVAVTIAIVASIETLLCIEAVDKQDPLRRLTPVNRELKAQGVGNLVAGLIGGIPLTAVIVRGSANVQAGGRTRMSAFIHGVLLLVAVLFLGSIMNLIPLAALAAVLVHIGYKLAPVQLFVQMFKRGWSQFLPFVITFGAILFTDLLTGVIIGIIAGLLFVLVDHTKNGMQVDIRERDSADGHHRVLKLEQHVSFLNKAAIRDALSQAKPGEHVDIDGSEVTYIDHDVMDVLAEFQINAPSRGIDVRIIGLDLRPGA